MAPSTPSATPARPGSRAATSQASRVTRLRSAQPSSSTAQQPPQTPKTPGLLARSREGFKMVSDKMKEKEKAVSAAGRPKTTVVSAPTTYSESLQAFLRIRPEPSDYEAGQTRPYLEMQGDTDVLMRAPADQHRPHMPKPPHVYSFDRVFGPTATQTDFFANTTLPLVDQLLRGENGLLFAYGVSNSGKTYSVSGGNTVNSADRGVLPRAIDVVFNSIAGHESPANLRCGGLGDVTLTDEPDPRVLEGFFPDYEGISEESIKVDRNFSYAVFVSYAEVYNEKIFDLLDDVLPIHPSGSKPSGSLKRSSSHAALPSAYGSSMNLAAMVNGGGGKLTRRALALKNDPEGNGKYIAGLSEIRVRTRQEALAVFRTGQRARQVFGTLANRESSRSHGIFTIKVVRIHNGAPEDPDSAQVSRLAIVDLAGSERTRNTQTTGDRLKEAGNINKSLMVLGQCLEVLRANQQKMAASTPAGSKKKLAMVPFRHSKLTEVFQNFFVGDGRAVMIVHVNPFDTGFDENSHVMRFSAIAREIQTTAANKVGFPLLKRQISTQFSALRQAVSGGPMKVKVMVPVLPQKPAITGARLAMGRERESDGYVLVEEEIEVVEEDESPDSDDEDETDWMVEHLFDLLKDAKQRLYESEMRNATIEAEVREEAAQEMQEALKRMHGDFAKMFQDQVAASELKTDRKLDILSRTIPTPGPSRTSLKPSVDDTPGHDADADTSMDDQSFASADQSMSMGDLSFQGGGGRVSDPFLVRPDAPMSNPKDGRSTQADDDDDEESGSDTASESGSVSDDEEAVIAALTPDVRTQTRESTVESEDPLAADISFISQSSVTNDDEEEEEEEEDEEDDDEDDVYTSEEEADEEDAADDQESSFAASTGTSTEPDDASSSSDESVVRRNSVRRRKTGSPVKKSASPTKTTAKTVRAKPPTGAKVSHVSSSADSIITPLGERVGRQDMSASTDGADIEDDEDDDEDVAPVVKTPMKKRILGKKVLTEEEITAAYGEVGTGTGTGGARSVRGSVYGTPR